MVFDAQTTDVNNNTRSHVKNILLVFVSSFLHKKILTIATKTQSHNDGIVWEQEEEGRRGLFNAIIPDDDGNGNDDARRIRIGNKR